MSSPFCQDRRLITPSSRASAFCSRPKRDCRAALLAARPLKSCRSNRLAISLSVAGFQNAVQGAGPVAQQAIEAHAKFWRLYFGGIAGGDGGDGVGQRETGFEVANHPMKFCPFDTEGICRKAERWQQSCVKITLKGKVMNR
jgi:hypothetical protein